MSMQLEMPAAMNGADVTHTPEGEARCDSCGDSFSPRSQSGGKPQRYCSIECRRTADAKRKANAPITPTRGQRAQRAAPETPTTMPGATEGPFSEPTATKKTLLRAQDRITIEFDEATGEWVLKQSCWWKDDVELRINEEHAQEFLDALCDAFGAGGSPR